jgi:hypothetical protein
LGIWLGDHDPFRVPKIGLPDLRPKENPLGQPDVKGEYALPQAIKHSEAKATTRISKKCLEKIMSCFAFIVNTSYVLDLLL